MKAFFLKLRNRHFTQNIHWTKLWGITGTILAFWSGMASVLPPLLFKYVATILGALIAAFLFAADAQKNKEREETEEKNK